jgi:hypothetical protein
MCAQCMATAATIVGSAAGARSVAADTVRRHLGERGVRVLTGALIVLAVLASATLSGSS